MAVEAWMLGIGLALLVSIVASRLASRLGVPVLLSFLVLGMALGSQGPGGIWFSDARLAQEIGIVALAFIVFSGGIGLDWRTARPQLPKALVLATLGVAATAAVVGAAAHYFLKFSITEGLLLGAIVAPTDAAAVFSTLSRGDIRIKPELRDTLEMESGTNDPTGIFLAGALIASLTEPTFNAGASALGFATQMAIGGTGGWLVGRLGVLAMRKLRLEFVGLYHGLGIAIVLVAFGGTAMLWGSGFLAAYVSGVIFGNREFRQQKGLARFFDGVAWLMQIGLFVVLGLLVFPRELIHVAGPGTLVALILMFVARPLGVFVSLAPFRIPWRDQLLVSWCGLRGAVPIVLATFPLLADLPRAHEIFNLVFFVVVFSTVLQGPTIPLLAKRLAPDSPPVPEKP